MISRPTCLRHVGGLVQVDSLKEVVGLDTLVAGKLQKVVDVLHLLEGQRAGVDLRHGAGLDGVSELAQNSAVAERGMKVGCEKGVGKSGEGWVRCAREARIKSRGWPGVCKIAATTSATPSSFSPVLDSIQLRISFSSSGLYLAFILAIRSARSP